jgi:peptide/nickel transport system ATP-binding protein
MENNPILVVDQLYIEYWSRRGPVQAVRNVSFDLNSAENLSIIGESGSGKTTLGMSLVKLLPLSAYIKSGTIEYHLNGKPFQIQTATETELRKFRWKEVAMVFQGALNAFNPVITIGKQIYETAYAHGMNDNQQIQNKINELLQFVQLDSKRVMKAYQHELSGGMKQRILLALSLLFSPKILILDEPTSALDILTQRNIINLLKKIKQELQIAVIFISHDLSLAAELADRIVTVYAGRMVEIGTVNDIFYHPLHPYTKGLISATPTVTGTDRKPFTIKGSPPNLIDLPAGCAFAPRCPESDDRCRNAEPELVNVGEEHQVACFKKGTLQLS